MNTKNSNSTEILFQKTTLAIANWMRKLRNVFLSLFKNNTPSLEKAKDIPGIEISAEILKENFNLDTSNGNIDPTNFEQISASAPSFMRIGYQDGILGKDKALMNTIAKAWVINFRDHQLEKCEEKVQEIEGEHLVKQQILEDSRREYQLQQKYDFFLNKEYRRDSHKFSLFIGVFYLFISLSLIIADIPLALKLTQQGFDLDMDAQNPVQALFEKPWEVFQGNWEVFILAFGIALCAIFVKIYYDEFIGKAVDKVVSEIKNLNDIKTKKEKKAAKRLKKRRYKLKTALLIFSLSNIVLLGVFRFQTLKKIEREEQAINATIEDTGFSFLGGGASKVEEEIGFKKYWIEDAIDLLTFIFITLLFPVIGGVCASIGLNSLHNRKSLHRSKTLLRKAKSFFESSKDAFVKVEKEKIKWNNRKTWCSAEKFVEQLADFLYKCYLHGYESGYLSPEASPVGKQDLYRSAEILRSKKVSRKILDLLKESPVNGKSITS